MQRSFILLAGVLICFLSFKISAEPLSGLSGPHSSDSLKSRLRQTQPDTNRVRLLLELSRFYIYKPGELARDLDTALLLNQQAGALSHALKYYQGEGQSYLATSQAYLEKRDSLKGKQYIQKAIDIFLKHGYQREVAKVYIAQAKYYSLSKYELPERIRLTEKALALFKIAGDELSQAHTLKELGDLNQVGGNYDQSLIQLRQALSIYQSFKHTDLQGVYDLLGHVFQQMDDYQEAVRYGLLALKTAESHQDTSLLLCAIYNRLGLTYYKLRQFEQANAYFAKSLSVAQKHNDHYSILAVAGNRTTVLLALNKAAEALSFLQQIAKKHPPTDVDSQVDLAKRFLAIYRTMKQYGLAQRYCNQLLALSEKKEIQAIHQVVVYDAIIKFYQETQQYQEAQRYLVIHEALCKQLKLPAELSNNHLYWFKLDSARANYLSAISHHQQYKLLRDSILNEVKSKQIANLQIQYDTDKKNQDLKLQHQNIQLLTKQGQLQQTQLQQAQTTRNMVIGWALMLLILLGLGYNRYRLKQKSNQLLKAKQEEINQKNVSLQQLLAEKDILLEEKEWMMKEIHHRVKNNLQIITGLLYSQSAYLEDPAALNAIRESQNRVHAMALIHQKLYQSDRPSLVAMDDYIREIAQYLVHSFRREDTIELQLEVAEIALDVSLAVPVGLILNEALTNSLKYAFPHLQPGRITVKFIGIDSHTYWLSICDDGQGFPKGFDPDQSATLGLDMIQGLSQQVKGKLQIHSDNGVQISLQFNTTKLSKPHVLFS